MVSILPESYCNLQGDVVPISAIIVSILPESYCNLVWAKIGPRCIGLFPFSQSLIATENGRVGYLGRCRGFHSPRVLLQRPTKRKNNTSDERVSILPESYCNELISNLKKHKINGFHSPRVLLQLVETTWYVANVFTFPFSQSLIATSPGPPEGPACPPVSILPESYCNRAGFFSVCPARPY